MLSYSFFLVHDYAIAIYSNYFRGAFIECRDKDKDTPLLMAASKNHLETIRSLLSQGADIGAKDSNDETPIYRAASEGCIEALEVRLQIFMYCSSSVHRIASLRWHPQYAGEI